MIYIASDHTALDLKNTLVTYLKEAKYTLKDLGTHSNKRVHYTVLARKLCKYMLKSTSSHLNRGILLCGTGIGMSIMANRFKGIRAAVCVNEYMAKMSVRHNNANILCLGSRIIGDELAKSITKEFLNEKFDGGRHEIRVQHYDQSQ